MADPWVPPFLVTQAVCGRILRCAALPAGARHLFASRDVNVRADAPDALAAWEAVAAAMGVPAARLLRATQVHGCDVAVARRGEGERQAGWGGHVPEGSAHFAAAGAQPTADVLVSNDPDVAITVRVADCVPLLIADARLGVVAAVHAGWRGTASGAVRAGVQALAGEFGARPADLHAAIGPCIGPDVYEVGEDVRAAFETAGYGAAALARWFRPGRRTRPHLDVWTANTDQLVDAGVPRGQVHCARACTASHPAWFFSHRAQGAGTGRLVAAIRAWQPGA